VEAIAITAATTIITTLASGDTIEVRCNPAVDEEREADIGIDDDDNDRDRRPQRRRYEEPVASRLRRELVAIAENVRSAEVKYNWCCS
jgi:hypothetical protein